MRLDRLHLRDYRNYATADIAFAPGLTALLGDNGQGKTNVLEAVAYLATLRSFRSATGDVLVRSGAERAIVRAEGCRGDGREVLIEAEVARTGRNRAQLNRQRLARPADLVGVITVTVFTPEDLAVVKEGPQLRRDLLDDALVALDPRFDRVRRELERVLRQRNALLKQIAGAPLSEEASLTLSVWDDKLATVGERVRAARAELVERLAPLVAEAYQQLAGSRPAVDLAYRSSFPPGGLAEALAGARRDELRRAVTLIGPHRDDLEITLSGQPARTHASQGEQRTMALALKLAVHRLVTTALGEPPILLLDDVFSELDPQRAAALVAHLPPGQTVLTSADRLPPGAVPDRLYRVAAGEVEER